jgi:hypothetical protein
MDALKQEDGDQLAAQNRHSGHLICCLMSKRFKMKQITTYDVLIRVDNNVPPTRRPNSGRFPKKTVSKTVAKLEKSTVW